MVWQKSKMTMVDHHFEPYLTIVNQALEPWSTMAKTYFRAISVRVKLKFVVFKDQSLFYIDLTGSLYIRYQI
jgi:hypothetical protein